MTSTLLSQLPSTPKYVRGMELLVSVVKELSLARSFEAIRDIVRHSARELAEADGSTFVLREEDFCYYIDEDAISPLWKGKKFPMSTCISGWVMLNKKATIIEDIYSDSRIPIDAYRPTFVRSLAMIPIRTQAPIGAIGVYWAKQYRPDEDELRLLQALADTTSVAMEHVQINLNLEQCVAEKTAQLEAANKELESFSYAVSHDLRAPLRYIKGFIDALEMDCQLDATGKGYVERIHRSANRMDNLILSLLGMSRMARASLRVQEVNLSALAGEIITELQAASPQRNVTVAIESNQMALADQHLIRAVLVNLLSNAWKFTCTRENARIEFGSETRSTEIVYFVRDNGVGFNMQYADKLFTPFQRLHSDKEFEGSGVGLATAYRIVEKHGGKLWVTAEEGKGATFYFTLKPI